MGQVHCDIEVVNGGDLFVERRASPRHIVLRDVLMDSGATHLCLPAGVIAALGLPFDREVVVETATGASFARIYALARLTFEDRAASVDVIELPDGQGPLLGAIPMELLGIEPDLRSRSIRRLPYNTAHGYIHV